MRIIKVINRYNLNKTVEEVIHNSPIVFPMGNINELYHKLKPYTCASDEDKLIHGFGNVKCNKYGDDIIRILKKYYE